MPHPRHQPPARPPAFPGDAGTTHRRRQPAQRSFPSRARSRSSSAHSDTQSSPASRSGSRTALVPRIARRTARRHPSRHRRRRPPQSPRSPSTSARAPTPETAPAAPASCTCSPRPSPSATSKASQPLRKPFVVLITQQLANLLARPDHAIHDQPLEQTSPSTVNYLTVRLFDRVFGNLRQSYIVGTDMIVMNMPVVQLFVVANSHRQPCTNKKRASACGRSVAFAPSAADESDVRLVSVAVYQVHELVGPHWTLLTFHRTSIQATGRGRHSASPQPAHWQVTASYRKPSSPDGSRYPSRSP